jgi:NAD+ kinase
MKLLIYGKSKDEINGLMKGTGFEIVHKNPDVVVSYGGDGTFMKCEKDFPGIPKFILKKSRTSKKGHDIPHEDFFKKISGGEYRIEEEIKIEAVAKGKKIVGLNEIVVHNRDPRQAIRYLIFVNGRQIGGEVIGDGVVISTPFGSTGYYKSITDGFFEVGIGVAFNNSTEQSIHMVLKEDSEIMVRILRGPAMAYADNHSEEIKLMPKDEIVIKKSEGKAKIIRVL